MMSYLTMKMTMTMRTAIAGEALVMKYRVVCKDVELVQEKNISLVLLNQLLGITRVSCSYRTSRPVYQEAGLSLAVTMFLSSSETDA